MNSPNITSGKKWVIQDERTSGIILKGPLWLYQSTWVRTSHAWPRYTSQINPHSLSSYPHNTFCSNVALWAFEIWKQNSLYKEVLSTTSYSQRTCGREVVLAIYFLPCIKLKAFRLQIKGRYNRGLNYFYWGKASSVFRWWSNGVTELHALVFCSESHRKLLFPHQTIAWRLHLHTTEDKNKRMQSL